MRLREAFYMYRFNGMGWFRIYGYGLIWKDTTRRQLTFSERNGLKKRLRIGKWIIGYLPKN